MSYAFPLFFFVLFFRRKYFIWGFLGPLSCDHFYVTDRRNEGVYKLHARSEINDEKEYE